jgi:hypothetical protein
MVVFSLLGIVFITVMSVSLGQAFLAQGQLQTAVDAGARAAVDMLRRGQTQLVARVIARIVAQGTSALEGPVVIPDGNVAFGDFDHNTGTFTQGGTEHSPAVEITAGRTASSPSGPLNLILGDLLGQPQIEIKTRAVASTGCREIVFAIDVSQGMEQEIDEAYQVMLNFANRMRNVSRPGDKIGITVYAGDALSMREYALNGGPFWAFSTPEELVAIPADQNEISGWVTAMGMSGNFCRDPMSSRANSRLPTLDPGSCVGKGDHHGIYQAMQMFDDLDDSCSEPGERLIVLITSDIPCAYPGWVINERGTPYFGGTIAEAYAAADAAAAAGISMAPILIDNGRRGNCPRTPSMMWQHTESAWSFVNNMARGFSSSALINPPQNEVDDLIDDVNEVLFVRMVD